MMLGDTLMMRDALHGAGDCMVLGDTLYGAGRYTV